MNAYFRSLAYGFNPPVNDFEPAGCVLWFAVRPSQHVRVIGELPFSQLPEQELAAQILARDRKLGVPTIAYTVASPIIFAKKLTQYPGVVGEYVADHLAHYGVPVIPADADEPNGFARVQALLRPSPNSSPWLTIDPLCEYLIKSLGSAMSDDTKPDELAQPMPALVALRYAAMSRPSPDLAYVDVEPPFGSPAYIMRKSRADAAGHRAFGTVR